MLPAGVHAAPPEAEGERGANLTQAYRLNLDMLALVALFTGAFLVFSSQVLALLRRRTQLALLRTLGVTRGALAAAAAARRRRSRRARRRARRGARLRSGRATRSRAWARISAQAISARLRQALHPDPGTLAFFFVLGVAFAVLGAAAPAWEAARRAPARALRAGDEEESLARLRAPWWGILATAAGLLLTLAPAMNGLPVAGYVAIALMLLGAVLLMPWLAEACLDRLPLPAPAPLAIAVAQLKATPRQSAISIAAIVTSVSLMVSMLIMVNSFRTSLERWLERMLPADLYLRAARSGETAFLGPDEQARIAATPGLARVQFLRSQNLLLDAGAAARDAARRPGRRRPDICRSWGPPSRPPRPARRPLGLRGRGRSLPAGGSGDQVRLPIAGAPALFTVAGVWRDYVRQSGAVAIDRELYIELTGDRLANDAAIWLAPEPISPSAERALRERLPADAGVEIATTRRIRANSLALFDRTFAITYALEVAAVLIGLFGVSVSFSAQALARRREFGVLRHLGMTRREIGALLACEGALVSALGVAFGLAVGWVLSLILIHVVNRQSFHWSMDLDRAVARPRRARRGRRRRGGRDRRLERAGGDGRGRGARGARGLVKRDW